MQNTRLNSIIEKLSASFEYFIFTSWKKTSAALLALLLGFYLGSSLTAILLVYLKERSLTALIIVAIVEITVRLRNKLNQDKLPIFIIILDNLRLGSVYAVVLEAFKLGS